MNPTVSDSNTVLPEGKAHFLSMDPGSKEHIIAQDFFTGKALEKRGFSLHLYSLPGKPGDLSILFVAFFAPP